LFPQGDGKLLSMTGDLRRLDGVVDESTLLHTWMDTEAGEVVFQLGILAHPPPGQAARPERLLRLKSVSRIAAWLRDMERIDHPAAEGFPGFGYPHVTFDPIHPPVNLSEVEDLTAVMNSYSPELYWLPELIFDDPTPPEWLATPSIDVQLGPIDEHSMHIWVDQNPGLGSRELNLYVVFESVQIFTDDLSEQSVDQVADEVKAWWWDMRGGGTNGQFGIVPAAPLDEG